VHMSNDPLLQLEAAIALAAQERDEKIQKSRDDQTAREERRDQARAVWAERKKELPAIVETINRMLRGHGFEGLAIGTLDSKHSDVDRLVIDFAHSRHSHTKILLCVTTAGKFTCTVGAVQSHADQNGLLIEQLSEVRLKEVLAKAVEECLSGKQDQRPPMVFEAAAEL
jgi:cupin superfamily acireductone dioxygenase involved in methionine salvage